MRIHLIIRPIWPHRTHSEDVHVGVVEILRLGDEDHPPIPPNESLLGGVAMEMGVSCCLRRPRTPTLPRMCFEADQRPSATRSCAMNTFATPTYHAASCHSQASAWIGVLRSHVGAFVHCATQRRGPRRRIRAGAPAYDIGPGRALQLKSSKPSPMGKPELFFSLILASGGG